MLNSPRFKPCAIFLKGLVCVLLATLSASCGGRQPQEGTAAGPTPQAAASPAQPIPWGTIQPPAQVSIPAGTPSAPTKRLPVKTFRGTGLVRSINLAEGWFEIDHEEIEGYMPAMKMQWRVKDKALLNAVSIGDKVDFTLEDDNGSEIITGLKKAPVAR